MNEWMNEYLFISPNFVYKIIYLKYMYFILGIAQIYLQIYWCVDQDLLI